MAIGHFILSLSFFALFYSIMFSLLWSEGTKGSDLDGGSGNAGEQMVISNGKDHLRRSVCILSYQFSFFLFVAVFVCLASQSVFSVRAGLGREDTFFFSSFYFLFSSTTPFWGGIGGQIKEDWWATIYRYAICFMCI